MEFSIGTFQSSLPIVAEGHYSSSRFTVGWDKFYLKTYSAANPFIQCWSAGYLEGVLSHEEIYNYYNNIHVFFKGNNDAIDDIKNFYKNINENLSSKLNISYFKTLNENDYKKWLHFFCIKSQLEGLHAGYSSMIDVGSKDEQMKKLSLLDFYFINSEGNFSDIKGNKIRFKLY